MMNKVGFRSNTTMRLSCRKGDFLMWCGFKGLFSRSREPFNTNDIWQLKDGDHVLITNRVVDLPDWFELYPTEAANTSISWMQKKLSKGYSPNGIMDGPNIWRILSGDRIAWVGDSRAEVESENGVLSLFTFKQNAIVIGEPFATIEDDLGFGGFSEVNQSQRDLEYCHNAWNAVLNAGIPRQASMDGSWTLG